MSTLLRKPLVWGAVLLALAMGLIMTASYLGAFLDPTGNMKNLPIAIASEDTGATIAGQPEHLGRDVIAAVTGPNGPLGDGVRWSVLATRDEALAALDDNTAYAAIVIPPDYSQRIAALFDPAAVAGGTAGPATIEILTNPAAGAFAGADGQQISLGVVSAVSDETSARIMAALSSAGVQMPATMAGALARPVQASVTVAEPVGDTGGRGLAPFYFVLMLTLGGFVAANVIDLGVRFAAGSYELEFLGRRFRRPRLELSLSGLWGIKLLLVLVAAVGMGLLQTALAAGPFAMTVSDGRALAVFSILGAAAVGAFTLLLLTVAGEVGALLGVLATTIIGVPSAGGVYPLQMVPDAYRVLGDWLPLRYLADGARSIVFFNGRLEAGLGTAIFALGAYLVASVVLGGVAAAIADRIRAGRTRSSVAPAILEPGMVRVGTI